MLHWIEPKPVRWNVLLFDNSRSMLEVVVSSIYYLATLLTFIRSFLRSCVRRIERFRLTLSVSIDIFFKSMRDNINEKLGKIMLSYNKGSHFKWIWTTFRWFRCFFGIKSNWIQSSADTVVTGAFLLTDLLIH